MFFDGERRNVALREIIDVEGRRTPDHTVAQRTFRFAFLLITPEGEQPSAEQLAQLDAYREQFAPYFYRVTGQNATADTSLARAVHTSAFPAVGVLTGGSASLTVSVEQAASAPLTFTLRSKSGVFRGPQSVVIPAGASSVKFNIAGVSEGVDDLIIEPADPGYQTVTSRIQVLPVAKLKLAILSESSPVQVKATDNNDLPYPGIIIQAKTVGGGSLDRPSFPTSEDGVAEFTWVQSTENASQLQASIASGPSVTINAAARPAFSPASVLNAASLTAGIVPGGIASVFGANMGGTNARVFLNGRPATVLFANAGQVNFVVPADVPTGTAQLAVQVGNVTSTAASIAVLPVQPGIFFDSATGFGAISVAGTGQLTLDRPAQAGDSLEIYATGLGSVRGIAGGLYETVARPEVTIGSVPTELLYSGMAPGFTGLYQVNVRVPAGLAPGDHSLILRAAGAASNQVKIGLQ